MSRPTLNKASYKKSSIFDTPLEYCRAFYSLYSTSSLVPWSFQNSEKK